MELTINHQKKSFAQWPSSLEALLLLEMPHSPKGIAVAVNNMVIPREQWCQTILQNDDDILIITATQGG